MDEAVFDRVYKEHFRPLCYYASIILKEKYAAEDIVQEAFIKLWLKNILEKECKIFLIRIIKNACYNHNKHTSVVSKYETECLSSGGPIVESDNLIKEFVLFEFWNKCYKHLARMPAEKRRVAFYLRYFKRFSINEIAYLMNNKGRTVKEHLQQGIKYMRIRLKENNK